MKIAIIGTGITGNAAAWLLHEKHDITVYEQNDYIGGHSNTIEESPHPAVDTGFIVYNEWTYPNLIALFDHLGVETIPTDMSFGVSMRGGALEYAGDALFAQKNNLFKPGFYQMIFDVMRFYKNAPEILEDGNNDISLGEYLSTNNYSNAFIEDHILPMAAAIWSTEAQDVRDFPAVSFIRFFVNHGLLLLKNRPQWYTVKGGSREYVIKLTEKFKDKILIGTAAKSITRYEDHVSILDSEGTIEDYNHVIIATHSDQALALLSDASNDEKSVLKSFPYADNIAYLHQDKRMMPKRPKAWSSWNYLTESLKGRVCVTYWMNRLQPFIGDEQNYFVTLNPENEPDHIIRVLKYQHPQFTMAALKGWDKIKTIQGVNRTWFGGAWCGYGFHEDGLSAGLAIAEELGDLKRPWEEADKSPAGKNCRPSKK